MLRLDICEDGTYREVSPAFDANELKCRRPFPAHLLMLVVSLCMPILAQQVDSYVTEILLPMDLHTADGILLPQGHFDLKVQIEKGGYLSFSQRGNKWWPLSKFSLQLHSLRTLPLR